MERTHDEWMPRLSEYIDGGLPAGDAAALEEHLSECRECRETVMELRSVVVRARAMGDAAPERDLWPGIAGAIGAPAAGAGARVIALPTARGIRTGTPGLFLSRWQLAAAAGILVVISVGVTSLLGPGLGVRVQPGVATVPAGSVDAGFATVGLQGPAGLADEVLSLESMLEEIGSTLDPNTLRIIERNLVVIERAIEDSRRALEADPGSDFLEGHLVRAWERKRDFLQGAVRAAEWSG